MRIASVQVSGYRKIENATITFGNDITVLAGANNSGKTSVVELFSSLFDKGGLATSDVSITAFKKWYDHAWPRILDILQQDTDAIVFAEDVRTLLEEEGMQFAGIEIRLHVTYDPKGDDIRRFADYLMDLDEDNTSFYFLIRYRVDLSHLVGRDKPIVKDFPKLRRSVEKLATFEDAPATSADDEANCEEGGRGHVERLLRDMFGAYYLDAFKTTAYFADCMYEVVTSMEMNSFKSLFNFKRISAVRRLDDEATDKGGELSRSAIEIARSDENWNAMVLDLPDQVSEPFERAEIMDHVRAQSIDTLQNAMSEVSTANGGHAGTLVLDMAVTDESVLRLIENVTHVKYAINDYCLGESSQGLGFNNLMYILLELEKFKKSVDPLVVNFFVIEEPESHMHPQMQAIFTKCLFRCYKETTNLTGMVTTHSHEVVRDTTMTQLRVLREKDEFTSELYDFQEFIEQRPDEERKRFYSLLYGINFSDIIFSDRVILYEGDTERMLIKSALGDEAYKTLHNSYVSYVQVGGAYACYYLELVRFLKIKTLVITDIDYESGLRDPEGIKESETTNATLNTVYPVKKSGDKPAVKDLYAWGRADIPKIQDGLVAIAFQGEKDGCTRTLEEAMLARYCKMRISGTKTRDEWETLRDSSSEKYKLKFSIPRKIDGKDVAGDTPINLRDIENATSNNKTDFMYSVILNELVPNMLPYYIERGLKWLAS